MLKNCLPSLGDNTTCYILWLGNWTFISSPQLAPLHSLDGLVLDPGGPNSAHLRGDGATRTGFDLRRNGWLDLRYDPVGGFVVLYVGSKKKTLFSFLVFFVCVVV